ncbi:MAG: hypothetical protein IJZ85_00315 [Lachnospiraceae bacterium]|nr:hypothetical protein [Lachnospiraceae bacterium]
MNRLADTRRKYEDIINLPHHISKTRPQMSMIDRAAQFSPFAALTGYDAAVKETARLTDERIELDESRMAMLDERLQMIRERIMSDEQPEVTITYFQPDERKVGGVYVSVSGCVKRIDEYARAVVMKDGSQVSIDDIYDMEMRCIADCD